MAHRVRFSAKADRDIESISDYLGGYSERIADQHERDLIESIYRNVGERPHTWQFFFLTGAPYRAYLFKLSRRTSYWVIYEVDDESRSVGILRIWNAARNPDEFAI